MIITFVSQKGGCGKTTSSIHFAALLTRTGSTLLIDEDPAAHALSWHKRGVERLPFGAANHAGSLRIARDYQNFVIDTKGGLEDEQIAEVYEGADLLIIPAIVESMTLESMHKTAQALIKKDPHLARVRVLFTQTRRTGQRKLAEARAVVQDLGLSPLQQTIRDTEAFKDACDAGGLVHQVKNALGKSGWLDYESAFLEAMGQRVPA
jgi:chromosome partitioning protein